MIALACIIIGSFVVGLLSMCVVILALIEMVHNEDTSPSI